MVHQWYSWVKTLQHKQINAVVNIFAVYTITDTERIVRFTLLFNLSVIYRLLIPLTLKHMLENQGFITSN